jgi:hypothetical protein
MVYPEPAGAVTPAHEHTFWDVRGLVSATQHAVLGNASGLFVHFHLLMSSSWHAELHPSPLKAFPSSHCSPESRTPLEQAANQKHKHGNINMEKRGREGEKERDRCQF